MLQAALESSVNAAPLGGSKTQETQWKAAGQNVKLMANWRNFGDIPPEMKVFAQEGQ